MLAAFELAEKEKGVGSWVHRPPLIKLFAID